MPKVAGAGADQLCRYGLLRGAVGGGEEGVIRTLTISSHTPFRFAL